MRLQVVRGHIFMMHRACIFRSAEFE